LPFNIRLKKHSQSKQIIAAIVGEIIRDGDYLTVDASSTTLFAVKMLKSMRKQITVITNSLEIPIELSQPTDIELLSTGGAFVPDYLAFSGPKTIRSLQEYNADVAILSCKGVDLSKGITDSNDGIAETKRAMIQSAKKSILVVDHTKFGRVALTGIAPIEDFDYVVTDKEPGAEWTKWFEKAGVICLYPGSQVTNIL
jgi:DeoR/GlpR family transcriptional regulator of sugar metabolism